MLMEQLNVSLTFDWINMYQPYWTHTSDLLVEPRRTRMVMVPVRQHSSASQRHPLLCIDYPRSTSYLWDRNRLWLTQELTASKSSSGLIHLHNWEQPSNTTQQSCSSLLRGTEFLTHTLNCTSTLICAWI